MTTLLQINTSIFSEGGASSQLASNFVQAYKKAHPDTRIVRRDLANEPVPHLTAERFAAFTSKPEQHSQEQRSVIEYSNALIAELRAADIIVLGLPMYNFGIPSQLKAYFDHLARAGVTFKYTAQGPIGLLTGKKAYVFATRGGVHAGTPRDTEIGYVREFLRFIGIDQVEFVYAEGLSLSPDHKVASFARATTELNAHLEKLTAAHTEELAA